MNNHSIPQVKEFDAITGVETIRDMTPEEIAELPAPPPEPE